MRRLFGFVPLLTGCFIAPSHDPVALDQLQNTKVSLATSSPSQLIDNGVPTTAVTLIIKGKQVGAAVNSPGDCPTISDSAVVTFDGTPLQLVDEGGWDAPIDGSSECHIISLVLDRASPRPGQLSQLLIKDDSATWTIEGPDWLTDDLDLTTPTSTHATITATSYAFTDAYVQFINAAGAEVFFGTSNGFGDAKVTITDKVADVEIPAGSSGDGTLSINVTRVPSVSRCDGPTTCDVSIEIGSDFPTTIP